MDRQAAVVVGLAAVRTGAAGVPPAVAGPVRLVVSRAVAVASSSTRRTNELRVCAVGNIAFLEV